MHLARVLQVQHHTYLTLRAQQLSSNHGGAVSAGRRDTTVRYSPSFVARNHVSDTTDGSLLEHSCTMRETTDQTVPLPVQLSSAVSDVVGSSNVDRVALGPLDPLMSLFSTPSYHQNAQVKTLAQIIAKCKREVEPGSVQVNPTQGEGDIIVWTM